MQFIVNRLNLPGSVTVHHVRQLTVAAAAAICFGAISLSPLMAVATPFGPGVGTEIRAGSVNLTSKTQPGKAEQAESPEALIARPAAVLLDDSSGMCGYLKPGSNYAKLLGVVQSQFERSRVFAGAQLSHLGKEGWAPAVAKLDQISAGAGSDRACPFRETTSPLGRFFKRAEDAPVALMVTDLIFDEGKGSGLAAGRNEFIEAALRWQQANSDNAGLGIVALRSAFEGDYFPGQRSAKPTRLKANDRPFYLIWRVKRQPQAAQFINDLLQSLQDEKLIQPTASGAGQSIVLMPHVGLSGQVSLERPLPLSELLGISGRGAVKPSFVYQLARGQSVDRPLRPEACLEWKDGQLLVDGRCNANGPGVAGENLGKLSSQVDWAHAVFNLGPGGHVQRDLVRANSEGGGDGGVRLCTAQVSKMTRESAPQPGAPAPKAEQPKKAPAPQVVVTLEPKGACDYVSPTVLRVADLRPGEKRAIAVVSLRPGAAVVGGGLDAHRSLWRETLSTPKQAATGGSAPLKSIIEAWTAEVEPCPASQASTPACAQAAKGTVGLEALVSALAARLDPLGRTIEKLNTDPSANFDLTIKRKTPEAR